MKQTRIIMGMPVRVEILDMAVDKAAFEKVFDYFKEVDARYSTYKDDSEISKINRGLPKNRWSSEMSKVLELCEQTKQETNGYFDIRRGDAIDPSGLVKGWAIRNAADILANAGFSNFYLDVGGDIQVSGRNGDGEPWIIGIRNPFNREEIIKVINVSTEGVATSGAYVRGEHIYNPHNLKQKPKRLASITVIGPNIYEADRFATAAFAMEENGAAFIESLDGFEAYAVGTDKIATYTSGFERYLSN